MRLSPMGLLNGHADPSPKDLPEPISLCNQMERCVVPPITHSTRQPRRGERDGSVRVLYAARIGHCRCCPLRAQCQENSTTSKPRRVSAVFWPLTSTTSPPDEALPEQPAPSRPVLWGDWERCHLRRLWFSLLRTQTVLLTFGSVQHVAGEDVHLPDVLTRAQRAHWRLSWEQRLARNARLPTTPPLEVTIHGLPVSFAHVFGFDVAMAA